MQCLIWQKLSLNLFHILRCTFSKRKSIRDGVSYVSNGYIKANNKYLKSYDPKQESKYIM